MNITLAHTKGGVGKSTAAWHLAHAFSLIGPVEIVDMDFNQTLHYVNIMAGRPFTVHQPRSVAELYDLIARTTHDVTLIMDIGGFDSDLNRAAIRHSDHVVIPITPDRVTEVLGFRTFDAILSELDTVDTHFHVLFNNVHAATRNFDKFKKAVKGSRFTILDSAIRSRKIYYTTMGNGQSVFSSIGNALAQTEILELRDELRRTR
ncbi:MAG: ParA family protein [Campylobacterota bacterium]